MCNDNSGVSPVTCNQSSIISSLITNGDYSPTYWWKLHGRWGSLKHINYEFVQSIDHEFLVNTVSPQWSLCAIHGIDISPFTMPNPLKWCLTCLRWAEQPCGGLQVMWLEMVSPEVSFPLASWAISINPSDSADKPNSPLITAAQHVISPISDWSSTGRIDGRPTLQYQPRPLMWHSLDGT